MKAVKLSLAAALVASSAMALELKDVKVSGEAKAWYQTKGNSDASQSLFGKNGASGQAMLKVGVSGSLSEKVGFGVTGVSIDTLGLENNTVSAVTVGNSLQTQTFLQEAFITYKSSNTTAKIGRQKLDTPLAFSEDWNIVENSFEALAVINTDIPNTTLVAAHVSKGNGVDYTLASSTVASHKGAQTITEDGVFSNYVTKGARAIGAINTSISGVTAQAWYYDVATVAKAYWLQADAKLPMNLTAGVQYASVDSQAVGVIADDTTTGYAVKLGTEVAGVNLSAAYSDVGASNGLSLANTATLGVNQGTAGGKKTKLYTASIMNDGTVAALPDVKAYKLSASTKLAGFDLGLSYGSYDVGTNNGYDINGATAGGNRTALNPTEIDLSVSTKIDDLTIKAYYINQTEINAAKEDQQAIRVIASIGF